MADRQEDFARLVHVAVHGTESVVHGWPHAPGMVRPHQAEFEPVPVRRIQKRFVQGLFEELVALIPIPVEHESGDAAVGGEVDLLRHPDRVGFVEISPDRFQRLAVSGKQRPGRLDQLPFTEPFAVPLFVMAVGMPAGKIDCKYFFFHIPLLMLFQCQMPDFRRMIVKQIKPLASALFLI